jgi:hypothetical protein
VSPSGGSREGKWKGNCRKIELRYVGRDESDSSGTAKLDTTRGQRLR